jgi:hypothetical protein
MHQQVIEVMRACGYILLVPAIVALVALPLNILYVAAHRTKWSARKKWRYFVLIYMDSTILVCTALFLWGQYLWQATLLAATSAVLLYTIPCKFERFNYGGWGAVRNGIVISGGLIFSGLTIWFFVAGY